METAECHYDPSVRSLLFPLSSFFVLCPFCAHLVRLIPVRRCSVAKESVLSTPRSVGTPKLHFGKLSALSVWST